MGNNEVCITGKDPAVVKRMYEGEEIKWDEEYVVDGSVLCVFFDTMKRLYDERYTLSLNEKRDMAIKMDSVLHHGFDLLPNLRKD